MIAVNVGWLPVAEFLLILIKRNARDDSSLNEGLYAQTLESNIRQWHQTVSKYLSKRDADYIQLDYTKPAERKH